MASATNANPNLTETPLYDPAGHQSVAMQSGTVVTDNSVSPPILYAPGILSIANVNADSIYGGLSFEEFIAYHTIQGHAFTATSGVLATVTNANVFIALGLLANNIAKTVYIYRITADAQNPTGDMHISQATSLDANLTAAITPLNNNLGSATTSLCTVKTTPNSNSAPTAASGTLRAQWGSAANIGNGVIELIQRGGIFIPANATQGITVWIKIPTAANTGQITIEYLEV